MPRRLDPNKIVRVRESRNLPDDPSADHLGDGECSLGTTSAMTGPGEGVTVRVSEEHHIAQARQVATALVRAIGFDQVGTSYAAVAVSELAGNIFLHATKGGTIILVDLRREGEVGIGVIAEDDGPGIEDLELALQDGFSTAGGLGSGLPGVKRLMDEFEIRSRPGVGTRIVARKWQTCR